MSGFGHSGEDIEKGGNFCGEGGSGSQEAKIGIEAGGARMIVARSEVKVGNEVAFFTANEEENLAVGFEPH
jgi:hypothetical protein